MNHGRMQAHHPHQQQQQQYGGGTYYQSPYEKTNMDVMPPIDPFNAYQPTANPHYPQMQRHYNNPCENKYTGGGYTMPVIEPNSSGGGYPSSYYQPQPPNYPTQIPMQPPVPYQPQPPPPPNKWSFKTGQSGTSDSSRTQIPPPPNKWSFKSGQSGTSGSSMTQIPPQPPINQQYSAHSRTPLQVQNRQPFPSRQSNQTLPRPSTGGKLAKKPYTQSTTQKPPPSATEMRCVSSATQFQSQFSITQNPTQFSQSNKKTSCNSTQFLAVNVYGMRAWSQLETNSNLIFELFGILHSRPTNILGGKKFTLKDHQGKTITCVFYESDRVLGDLMRGRVYRCVGKFKSAREQLHIVSIRSASDSNEFQAHKKIAALTATYLRQVKSAKA